MRDCCLLPLIGLGGRLSSMWLAENRTNVGVGRSDAPACWILTIPVKGAIGCKGNSDVLP